MYRQIPGYSLYFVNERGSVISFRRGRHCILKQFTGKRGYPLVNLWHEGRIRQHKVHRLVLLTFVGPCPPGMQCRHLNGIKTDNRLENLAWGTPCENAQDTLTHGHYCRGEQNAWSTLTESDVRMIREMRAREEVSFSDIARMMNVSVSAVSRCVRRQTWSHVA